MRVAMQKYKEFIIVMSVSGIIGGLVGVPFHGEMPLHHAFLKSSLVGMAIGFASMLAFIFFYKNLQTNTVMAFSAIFITIGVGTSIGAYCLGVDNVFYIAIMAFLAELFGMTASIVVYKKTKVLNRSLRLVQEKYRGRAGTAEEDSSQF